MAFSWVRPVTIDPTKIGSTDLTNFPVLVSGTFAYLATVANSGLVQNANGYDIGFYADSACTTKLKWRRVKYVATTGQIIYYVKVPSVSHTTGAVFYMAYDDATISTDQSDPPNTWNANFDGVYLFEDGSTLSPNDDTANARNATVTGSPAPAAGQVGGAVTLTSGNHLDVASPAYNYERTSPFAVGFWLAFGSVPAIAAGCSLVGHLDLANGARGWEIEKEPAANDNLLLMNLINTSPTNAIRQHINWAPADTNFHRVWFTYDGSSTAAGVLGYVDGVVKSHATTQSGTDTDTLSGTIQNSVGVRIGDRPGASNSFTGYMDELQFVSAVVSPSWVTADFNNQSSPSTFLSVGAASPPGGGGSSAGGGQYNHFQRMGVY